MAARYSVPGPARKPLAFLRIRLRFRACLGPPFTRGMVSSFPNKWSQRHSPDHLGGHGCAGDAPALAGSSSSLPVAGGDDQTGPIGPENLLSLQFYYACAPPSAAALAAARRRVRLRAATLPGLMNTPISFRSRRACVSETIAAFRSLRRLLAGRALIRCDVNAWWRLSLPVLVTRKRLAIALLGFIALRGMPC